MGVGHQGCPCVIPNLRYEFMENHPRVDISNTSFKKVAQNFISELTTTTHVRLEILLAPLFSYTHTPHISIPVRFFFFLLYTEQTLLGTSKELHIWFFFFFFPGIGVNII